MRQFFATRFLRFLAAVGICTVFSLTAMAASAQEATATVRAAATETSYQSRAETSYQPRNEISHQAALMSIMSADTETTYNPNGTYSPGSVALLSTRRSDPAFPAFLLGMQDAAQRATGSPLNVAPLKAQTLGEQASQLASPSINIYLVDAPNPGDAKEFFEHAGTLGRKAALISYRLPTDYYPAVVVDSPILWAERIGEEAIRFIGTDENEVAYVLQNAGSDEMKESLLRSFGKPFANVAPKIKLVEIDPVTYKPGLVPPAAVCIITAEDSGRYAPILRAMFPDSKIIAAGEDPVVISAFENKLIDVRVRPDYARLLGNAMREAQHKSEMPVIVHPTMDKWWK